MQQVNNYWCRHVNNGPAAHGSEPPPHQVLDTTYLIIASPVHGPRLTLWGVNHPDWLITTISHCPRLWVQPMNSSSVLVTPCNLSLPTGCKGRGCLCWALQSLSAWRLRSSPCRPSDAQGTLFSFQPQFWATANPLQQQSFPLAGASVQPAVCHLSGDTLSYRVCWPAEQPGSVGWMLSSWKVSLEHRDKH